MNNMPSGEETYKDNEQLSLLGIRYSENELQQSIIEVKKFCFDTTERDRFNNFVNSISDTGFSVLTMNNLQITSWQVGEGLAEAYLTNHFSCYFPWSSNRDLKNPQSSLTGADLVGFYDNEFAFGEVKTSSEERYPPQVTYQQKDGLNTQLNKLCNDKNLQTTLIQYLFHRLKGGQKYKNALKKYLQDNNDYNIFGVLVRDTEPNIADWYYLKNNLQPHNTKRVFLIALYLPKDGIEQLHQLVSEGGKL